MLSCGLSLLLASISGHESSNFKEALALFFSPSWKGKPQLLEPLHVVTPHQQPGRTFSFLAEFRQEAVTQPKQCVLGVVKTMDAGACHLHNGGGLGAPFSSAASLAFTQTSAERLRTLSKMAFPKSQLAYWPPAWGLALFWLCPPGHVHFHPNLDLKPSDQCGA